MDVDAIEKLGNAPLLPWLKYIDAINDKDALVTACTEFSKHDMDNFFGWWISQDPHDSSRKVFYLSQTSFSLPDKTYYLEDSDEMRKHREVFVAVASKLYSKVGYTQEEADKLAAAILEFETNIAKIQVDKEISRKDHGTQIEWSKMEELMPFWPWKSWLQQLSTCTPPPDGAAQACTSDHPDVAAVGQPDKTQLYLMSADFFPKMNKLLEDTSFDTVKAVMSWQVIRNGAIFLSAEFIDTMVELNADLYGMKEKNPRDRKCYYSASGITAWPLAKLYVDELFHKANRAATLPMLEGVRAQFMSALPNEKWMNEADRVAAQHKLSEMFFQVAWPTDEDSKDAWPPETTDMQVRP